MNIYTQRCILNFMELVKLACSRNEHLQIIALPGHLFWGNIFPPAYLEGERNEAWPLPIRKAFLGEARWAPHWHERTQAWWDSLYKPSLEVIPLDTWLLLTEPLFYGVRLSSEFQIRTTLVSSIAVPTFPPDTWQDTWCSKGDVLRPGKSQGSGRSPWDLKTLEVSISLR